MTIAFDQGSYGVRRAETPDDLRACQALRHRCFFGTVGLDTDKFDAKCDHYMIANKSELVATFRVMILESGAQVNRTYAADSYDLCDFATYREPVLEVGRFCIEPEVIDPSVLRLCWCILTLLVDSHSVGLLIGCTSFQGVEPVKYVDAFHRMFRNYGAPKKLSPKPKAKEIVLFSKLKPVSSKESLGQMPPLLRSYLSMGGWVSDHAVIDRSMQTIHVFTGLEVNAIPEARAKSLRAIAASGLA